MAEFLRQVADHYILSGDVGKRCFIFPNRRSLTFFRKYLAEAVARTGSGPMVAPRMLTMNDFFYHVSDATVTDRVMLLLELYGVYKSLNPKAESLDDFIFWGDVLLSDFDDVDKYLVDPKQLFANVHDFKSIQDTYTYLTDRQREAIDHFLEHFKNSGRITANIQTDSPGVKEKFLQIWDILYRLYSDFNVRLKFKGMAYEGMVYKSLAERVRTEPVVDIMEEVFPAVTSFVFVGLNALNECEKRVMGNMRDAGIAEFCWDYSGEWLRDSRNKSTVFMDANVAAFPQAFRMDVDGLGTPVINVLSVPSSIGQTKQISSILERIAAERHCGDVSCIGTETAIVLPDEDLLIPALNSIPSEITDINVTMGYPMGSSEFFTLMNDVSTLQLHMRKRGDDWYFYHKQVWSIFSNSVFKAAVGDGACQKLVELKSKAQYYILRDSLLGCAVDDCSRRVLESVFKAVVTDVKDGSSDVVHAFEEYHTSVITSIAPSVREDGEMAVELEFAKDYYNAVTRLRRIDLPVLPMTYVRLLNQLVGSASVPFQGEPLKGMQIMGPLETRALDFKNLVILSCNEGTFPRRSVSSSFIPPELRKGFDLPTYEYQDAVWAYYFYRLLQRAETVWMLYDSRTEGMKAGEESRYIKQLELHFGADVHRMVAKSPIGSFADDQPIHKTEEDMQKMKDILLSASALKDYISCPVRFYYRVIKGLRQEDDVAESLDASMIGNVFHNTMFALYFGETAMDPAFVMDRENIRMHASLRQEYVTRDYIRTWLGREDDIKARIRSLIMTELKTFELVGRNIVFADVVFQYVKKVLERDLEYLIKEEAPSFRILGLELPRYWEYGGFKFIGYIDRLDSIRDDQIRVIDYKTGKVEDNDIHIDVHNAEDVVNKLFGKTESARPKIALQLFLYDMFVHDDAGKASIVNSIYSPANLFVSEVEDVSLCDEFIEPMKSMLSAKLAELADPAVDFTRAEDKKACEYCDFKMICGR